MGVREQVTSRFQVARWMGDEALISCPHPDHDDRHPSASINIRKRLWTCYSCGAGGSLERLLGERVADQETDELIEELRASLTTVGATQKVYPERWLDQFEVAGIHPYWRKRGLSDETIQSFRLGYDFETNRATYPLRSPAGDVWGVASRAVGAQLPKYLYPDHAPVSKTLFGYDRVRVGVTSVVLCEGAMDALAMWDVGIPAVAQLGGSLSSDQEALLRRLGLVALTVAYDEDNAGQRATERLLRRIDWTPVRVMHWEGAKDPADLDPEERVEVFHDAELAW